MTSTPTPHDRISAATTLARLLDAELAYDTDARHGFNSHLSMGLVAAARLGADPPTLERWFEEETADGYLLPRSERPAWLTEGIDRVQRNGMDAEVRSVLPDLVDRTGGFFHWMIRMDLAIDAGHTGQVANALGDWQRRPRRDPAKLPAPTGTRQVADVFHEVWTSDQFRSGSAQRSHGASDLRRQMVTEVADGADLLDQLAPFVADLHWAVDDFTTLHLVTGTRAARALVPHLDESGRQRLAHAHLHAVAAVLPGLPRPERGPNGIPNPNTLPDWNAIGAAAIASGDAHVVKLTYAAQLEEATTGEPIYKAIAARATNRSPV